MRKKIEPEDTMKKRKMNRTITIEVGERLKSGKHKITSEFGYTETINVLKNMASLLDAEYPLVKFIEADKVKK
jgi:hypothetical protein